MFSTFKSLVGFSPYEIIKKKNGTIEKGKFKPLKASDSQQTRWTVPCVFQETKWVSFSRRGTIHSAWSSVNKAELPLLFMFFIYSGPCVLAPVFSEALKALQKPQQ